MLNIPFNKLPGKAIAKAAVKKLLSFVKICVTDKGTINKAYNSSFIDIEDAVQYYSAAADKAVDFLVTRNAKDYKYTDEHLAIITTSGAVKILS
jgi:hypothetical protein